MIDFIMSASACVLVLFLLICIRRRTRNTCTPPGPPPVPADWPSDTAYIQSKGALVTFQHANSKRKHNVQFTKILVHNPFKTYIKNYLVSSF